MTTQEEQKSEALFMSIYDSHFDPGEGLSRVETLALNTLSFAADAVATAVEAAQKFRNKSADIGRSILSAIGSEH